MLQKMTTPRRNDPFRNLPAIALLFSLIAAAACAATPAPDGANLRTPPVRSMSLDEKIGQLFVIDGAGTFMNEESRDFKRLLHHVRDNHVGGVIWYGADVYETAWATDRLQHEANVPLLVSADLESGIGMRFANTTFWPWAMAVAATGDPRYAEIEGRIAAEEARIVGINQIYAPVADVNNNPDNPVINVRSYGEDPEQVARFVSAFIRGVQSQGVVATVKHFPGHGDVATDSHRALPTLDISRDRLEHVELVPFRAAIAAGVDSVMLAHLSAPEIDPTALPSTKIRAGDNPYAASESEINRHATLPTSLSPLFVQSILRGELGFKGLVVTDALDMGGITDHFGPGEAAVRAIEAGADQVLKSEDTDVAIRAVRAAVESGRIPMARIDESVARVLDAKRKARRTTFDVKKIFRGLDRPDHRAIAEEIAEKSITLVREEPGVLPIRHDAHVVELVIGDFPEASPQLLGMRRELKERLGGAPARFVFDRRSREEDVADALRVASSADVVLIELTIRTRSGAGAVAVSPVMKSMLERLASTDAKLVAISFGNPYLLREVPFLRTYFAAWGVQPVMQHAIARALFGETPVTGRLPITIPGVAARGDGITRAGSEQ